MKVTMQSFMVKFIVRAKAKGARGQWQGDGKIFSKEKMAVGKPGM